MPGESVSTQELVAHFYALHDGQNSTIRAIWSRCGPVLSAVEPIVSTGLPVDVPESLPERSALIAARWDPATRMQAIMRREHEVVNISVLFKHRPGHSWLDFDRMLDALLGDSSEPLLGSARLYLGLLPQGRPTDSEDSVSLGRTVAQLLPTAELTPGWWHQGLTLDNKLMVWETGAAEDDRESRRFAVLADPAHERALSAWTWSHRGATHLPPFARYLMHLAKIRDQLRVRRQAPNTAELCRRIEDTLARFGGTTVPPAAHAALARTITSLEIMAKTVRVSWDNAAAAVGVGLPTTGNDPFSRDHALTTWFDHQLRDDAEYLSHYDREIVRRNAFPPTLGRNRAVHSVPLRRPDGASRTVLVIADKWFGHLDGISTLNRPLCEAMAKAGAVVYCLVPKSTAEERDNARTAGVQLVDALSVHGLTERESLIRKPPLPDDVVVDMIIGHGRVTGQVAQALAKDYYPNATHLHLVHVAPDQVEWYTLDQENDAGQQAEERSKIEIALAAAATRVVPVGPRLDEWMRREMHVARRPPPVCLTPGFDLAEPVPRVVLPGVPQIVLLARTEEENQKGIDIAARAIGHAIQFCPAGSRWELLIRGAPKGQANSLRTKLLSWIDHPAVDVTVRNDSPDHAHTETDLRRASLLLMPSRVEELGLVALEAVRAGTPALISGQSGLAKLMSDTLDKIIVNRVVVPITRTIATDVETWGNRIAGSMLDLPAAFATADEIRHRMACERTWDMAARALLGIEQ